MKRALTLAVVLLLLSAGGLAAAGGYVNAARAQVILTETPLRGDPAEAAGLSVALNTYCDGHLFWDTRYRPDAAAAETDFRFSLKRVDEQPAWEPASLRMENELAVGLDLRTDCPVGIALAYQALLAETPEGETRTKTVRLKDYYDNYPLVILVDLPGNQSLYAGWTDYAAERGTEPPEPGTYLYAEKKLLDFFRIPLPPEAAAQISVERDGAAADRGSTVWGQTSYGQASFNGVPFHYGWDSAGAARFDLQSISVVAADACYFTFTPRTRQGEPVDTSLIPGGYGIYRLPYDPEGYVVDGQKRLGIDTDGLVMACPLSPDIRPVGLYLSPAEDALLLLSLEDGQCVLTVIDMETMAPVQRLELGAMGPDDDVWQVFDYGDFLAVWLSGDRLALVDRDGAGTYRHRFTLSLAGDQGAYVLSRQAVMDWDGNRLAIADILPNVRRDNRQAYCSFCLAVYDGGGLRYAGEYRSSLDAGDTPDRYPICQRVMNEPLSLRWDGADK